MLITFEGGEGSGKGTISKMLADYLSRKGLKVKVGREPGSVPLAEEIRKVIQKPRENSKLLPAAELFLFEAARAQFVDEFLIPHLEMHDVVILDRFYDSSTAYQGYGRGIKLDIIHELNMLAANGIKPDITFIFDLPPELGLERCEKHEFGAEGDRIEQEDPDFHERLRGGYLEMAENDDRFVVIDVEKHDIQQTFEMVKKHVEKLL
ncbi:dTMP kinase [Nanoarchaeota archaeon]